ncbi:UPF0147 family protein [Candidatus Woesearchaeota archaeon]|nr:UPF0147 family protein [Candidatus Woesearchaeota archaeon]
MPGKFDAITDYLKELIDDNTVPRNIKTKIASIIEILEKEAEEDSIKVNKALDELEEISNDTNMQPFTRTQIWNVISLLENSL